MAPTVVKVKPAQLRDLEKAILADRHSSSLPTTSDHESFRIQLSRETIVGYKSGKVVSSGPHAAAAVRSALLKTTPFKGQERMIIGSDEAGKGEWLGPLVTSAVALTSLQSVELQGIGVADIKGIPPSKIAELARDIESGSLAYGTVLVTPKRFNEMFAELHKEGKSLNDLLAWSHAKVISEVYSRLKGEWKNIRVVIDEFSRIKTEWRLARVLDLESVELIQRPRAEDEIAVAAASIVAREGREKWIDRESRSLGIDLRELSPIEADARADRSRIAKTQYLDTMRSKR